MIGSNASDLVSIKQEIQGKEDIRIESVNILFLDISSTCTGYAIMNVNFETKRANLVKAGAVWLNPDWSHQEKYHYMYHAISSYFWVVEKIDHIVVEQYSVNPMKMMGVNVVSEMQGSIKAAAWENGVKVNSILPQTWRSVLKIKKIGKDFKGPTKTKVLEYVSVPEESVSNITKSTRKTPSDLYDAIAIGIAWLNKYGISNITFKNTEFNTHVSVMGE